MVFKMKLDVSDDILASIRDLPTRVLPEFRNEMQTVVKPAVQKAVEQYLAPYPPERSLKPPFEFATDKSRKAFFATNGFGRGIPTKRTGVLGKGWNVEVSYQLSNSLIRISNVQPYSRFVYGPRQIPGHAQTGWSKDFDTKSDKVLDVAENEVTSAWGRAVARAIK